MKKPGRKHWKSLKVHPDLLKHITGSPILAPYSMPPDNDNEELESNVPPKSAPPTGPLADL